MNSLTGRVIRSYISQYTEERLQNWDIVYFEKRDLIYDTWSTCLNQPIKSESCFSTSEIHMKEPVYLKSTINSIEYLVTKNSTLLVGCIYWNGIFCGRSKSGQVFTHKAICVLHIRWYWGTGSNTNFASYLPLSFNSIWNKHFGIYDLMTKWR